MRNSDSWDELDLYEIDGVAHTLPQWCRIYGISYATVYDRIKSGWPARRAIQTPVRVARSLTYAGETLTIKEWADRMGLLVYTLRHRLARGWPADRALMEPLHPGRPRSKK